MDDYEEVSDCTNAASSGGTTNCRDLTLFNCTDIYFTTCDSDEIDGADFNYNCYDTSIPMCQTRTLQNFCDDPTGSVSADFECTYTNYQNYTNVDLDWDCWDEWFNNCTDVSVTDGMMQC